MKFLSVALSGLMMACASAKTVSLKNNKVNKQKLMRSAVRVKDGKPMDRRLEEFEITGKYSIKFDSCLSLKTNNEDMFEEDLYNLAYNGYLTAQKSYVIFNVCETEYCGYDGAEEMQYMVELGTYIGALAEYIPNKKEDFCEACNQFEDYCNPEEEEGEEEEEEEGEEEEEEEGEEGDEEEEGEEDGDERKLKKRSFLAPKKRKLGEKNYIDCDECFNEGCYNEEEEDNDDQVDDEDVVQWIQELAECKDTEYNMDDDGDIGLSVGFMCNSDGDGVEIAVFVDDECSVYTTLKTFEDVMDEDDAAYDYSSDLVTYPFKYTIDCAGEIEYDDPDEENNDEDDNNDDEEDEDANEVCQELLGDDALDLETCGGAEDEDEEEEEEEEDDNEVDMSWWEYDIDHENAQEPEYVCKFLQAWEGESGSAYDNDSSGTHYDYTVYEGEDGQSSSSSGMSAVGKTIAIIVIVLAVAVAAVFAVKALSKKKQDEKAEPLTKKSGGAMA